jgi:hypothetical protein
MPVPTICPRFGHRALFPDEIEELVGRCRGLADDLPALIDAVCDACRPAEGAEVDCGVLPGSRLLGSQHDDAH